MSIDTVTASTEVAHTGPSSELEIAEGQTTWSPKQVAVLQTLGVENANQPELDLFFHQCQRTGLDPFARQIYMIRLKGKQTIQTAIDGYRLIARRAADRRGETIGYSETLWADEHGVWHEIWPKSKGRPVAAKITVYRSGQPFPALAMWDEYGSDKAMWRTMPAHMLAKVAEALALRRAFPQDLSGIYTSEEMDQAMADQDRAPAFTPAPAPAPQQGGRQFGIRANMAAAPAPTQAAEDAASHQGQWEEVAAWLDELGHQTNDAKRAYVQQWSSARGRAVDSVTRLTFTEAADLIAHLGREFSALGDDVQDAVVVDEAGQPIAA